eukprot:TRINITY_DN3912_c0_g3_i1.p1 TRINITY_DN3912_c0_g3~~TRINITY_DN3912_c0_g3_i1.p1  ORF type:complete len:932 (+),score=283.76 TRINITY_DN3912_c0_g3_i1:111-2906(+)
MAELALEARLVKEYHRVEADVVLDICRGLRHNEAQVRAQLVLLRGGGPSQAPCVPQVQSPEARSGGEGSGDGTIACPDRAAVDALDVAAEAEAAASPPCSPSSTAAPAAVAEAEAEAEAEHGHVDADPQAASTAPSAQVEAWEEVTATAEECCYNVLDSGCPLVSDPVHRRRVVTAAVLSEHAYKCTDKHYTQYHALKRLQLMRAHWGDLVQLQGAVEAVAMPNRKTPPMVVARDSDTLYVAFRGTKHLADWISDVHIRKAQLKNTPKGCEVHRGFRSRAEHYRNDILFDIIEQAVEGERRSVVLTGHSLGGAVACVKLTETLLQYARWGEFAEGGARGPGPYASAITFATPYWCNQALADYLSTGCAGRAARSMHNFFHPRDRVPSWTRSVGFASVGWYYYTSGPIDRAWLQRQFIDSCEQKTCRYATQEEDVVLVVGALCVAAAACVEWRGGSLHPRTGSGGASTSHVDLQLLQSFAKATEAEKPAAASVQAPPPEKETSHRDVKDYATPYFMVLKETPDDVLDHPLIERHLLLGRRAQQQQLARALGGDGAKVGKPDAAAHRHVDVSHTPPATPAGRVGWEWGLAKKALATKILGGLRRPAPPDASGVSAPVSEASGSVGAQRTATPSNLSNSVEEDWVAAEGAAPREDGNGGLCPRAHVTPASLRSGDAYGVFRTASPTSDLFAASRDLKSVLTPPPAPPPPPVTFTETRQGVALTFRVHPSGHAVEYLVNNDRPRPPITAVEYERESSGHVLKFPELGADRSAFIAPSAEATAVLRGLSDMFQHAHVQHNLPTPVSPNKGLFSMLGRAITQAATTVKSVGTVLSQASNAYSSAVKEPHRVQMFVLTFLIAWADPSYVEEPLTTLSASTVGVGACVGFSRGPTMESFHNSDGEEAGDAEEEEEECVDVDFDYFEDSDDDGCGSAGGV